MAWRFWKVLAVVGVTGCTPMGPGVVSGPPEVVMAAPVMEMAGLAPAPVTRNALPDVNAGVVTAGDIDDALNLAPFRRYQRGAARALSWPAMALGAPVLAQLRGPSGAPAPGVRVTLRAPGADTPFYDGYAGFDGMVTVFPAVLGAGRLDKVELRAFADEGATTVAQTLSLGGARQRVDLPFAGIGAPDFLDLAFVIDTTGSMQDELDWLAADIAAITGRLRTIAPGVDIRLGLVSYKAPGDPVVIRNFGFTRDTRAFVGWVQGEQAIGGAGGPEVVADALRVGVDMPWRRGKGERILIQIGDEPPAQTKAHAFYAATRDAAARNVQVFGLGASGAEAQLEFLMRQAAVATGGRYMFLTDDSSVGAGHAEPTISCYVVTALSDLIKRVLVSEVSGNRAEPAAGEIIRRIGSYDAGRCVE
ncbi:MAG: vWA domain-containing protein [Pseudomonadota bacterium]